MPNNTFHSISDGLNKYKRYRTTLRELRTLGDREMIDLGISAADMPGIARRSIYGS